MTISTPATAALTYYAASEWDASLDWQEAFELWLASRASAHTRRAYRLAWESFQTFTSKSPWQVSRTDVARWLDQLRASRFSPETIHQRLAALSSFYEYAAQVCDLNLPAGSPVTAIPRPRRSPYGKARYLALDEARALLRAVPRHTLQGQRDYALLLAYLLTGRRNTEIRTLRWGDLESNGLPSPLRRGAGGEVFYRWSGKGKQRRDQLPLPVWQAILDFLRLSGRLASIQPEDYLFTPLNDNALRLPHLVHPSPIVGRGAGAERRELCSRSRGGESLPPLSASMLNRLLKKYCRRAGLDPSRITIHTLRHTAAMLRKQVGEDLESISAFLGHSSLAVTQIYLHSVEGQADTSWQKVGALLGLSLD